MFSEIKDFFKREEIMSKDKSSTSYTKNKVIFTISITKEHIEQVVLSLALECHASERNIIDFLATVFDYSMCVGTVHNILMRATEKALEMNTKEIVTGIKKVAHDEIFQANKAILAGVDLVSYYCYFLQQGPGRDGTTWGIHLLDLKEKGLSPEYVIADGGTGLRSGQSQAWPEVPCYADVFHALRDVNKLITFIENRVLSSFHDVEKLKKKVKRAIKKDQLDLDLLKQLEQDEQKLEKAMSVVDTLEILYKWLCEDVLASIGDSFEERKVLFLWIIQELEKLEARTFTAHIQKVRIKLLNQHNDLILFVKEVDQKLEAIASSLKINLSIVHQVYEVQKLSEENLFRVHQENELRSMLGNIYYCVEKSIKSIIKGTFRASSAIENYNSRLRPYFFLRKDFKQGSLDLLRFFLNHKKFMRSAYSDRVRKSPAELLYQCSLPHWLEMLGFTRFKQAAA
jgi:hypothetical protein